MDDGFWKLIVSNLGCLDSNVEFLVLNCCSTDFDYLTLIDESLAGFSLWFLLCKVAVSLICMTSCLRVQKMTFSLGDNVNKVNHVPYIVSVSSYELAPQSEISLFDSLVSLICSSYLILLRTCTLGHWFICSWKSCNTSKALISDNEALVIH